MFQMIFHLVLLQFMYCTCILKEVGLRVENEMDLAGFAADKRVPYAQSVTVKCIPLKLLYRIGVILKSVGGWYTKLPH